LTVQVVILCVVTPYSAVVGFLYVVNYVCDIFCYIS